MNKVGRNDPCWCGSGQKYKKCHLDREAQSPLRPWEASAALKRAFSYPACLAPSSWSTECTKTIARAHTVSRAASLKTIARDGHVYSFIPTLENLTKHNGILRPELNGINRASTFSGFCTKHDDGIFAPLEKNQFVGSPEQCLLLAYRSFSRELYTKRAAESANALTKESDRGRPLEDQVAIQQTADFMNAGVSAALKDAEILKPRFDEILMSRKYSSVEAYIIEFEQTIPLVCSGSISPEQDFDGIELQDLLDLSRVPHLISVNLINASGRGYLVLTWLAPDAPTCRALSLSLHNIPDSVVASALLRLVFEFIENVHIAPDWWERLTGAQRDALCDRMANSANPFKGRNTGCLKEAGIAFAPWPVAHRQFVGSWASAL